MILSSLKSTREIAFGALWTIPGGLYLENFREVLVHPSVKTYFVNTFLVTVPATAGSIGLGILAGYVFSKLPFRGSELLFLGVVSGMFFPPPDHPHSPVPDVQRARTSGHAVADDHRAHRDGDPDLHPPHAQLLRHRPERAPGVGDRRGRERMQVLTRVALPISLPALAVLATLQFTWIWNDFLWPLIFTHRATTSERSCSGSCP